MVASIASTPSALPFPRTSLVGGDLHIARARTLLLDNAVPLLTLTGTGGVGKTRLALAIAHDVYASFADGVVFVDLSPIRDAELVLPAVGHVLSIREDGVRPIADVLATALRPRQLLLILDNCEQVVEAAPGIAELLANCPAIQVLATSRVPLRLRGEHLLPIPPLSLPSASNVSLEDLWASDAVSLFAARARAADPDFTLTAETAAHVVAICTRLDGLPLALELAASRLRALPLPALHAPLPSRLTMLTDGPRDLPERQRTLRETIAWSYDLLPEEDRRAFRNLAVFTGGFDLAAAQTVLGTGTAEGTERLTALSDSSLLVHGQGNDPTRYRMLETVREFAADLLAASHDAEDVRRRHASWCLAFTTQAELALQGPAPGRWRERLAKELGNIRAALGWTLVSGEIETGLRISIALRWFWTSAGSVPEGRRWLERLFAAGGDVSLSTQCWALCEAGDFAHFAGDRVGAAATFEHCLALAQTLADPWLIADAQFGLSFLAANRGDLEEAQLRGEEALIQYQESEFPVDAAMALLLLGGIARHGNDFDRARQHYDRALASFRMWRHRTGIAWAMTGLAEVAMDSGEAPEAKARFGEALRLHADYRETHGVGACLVGLAQLAVDGGHPVAGTRLLGARGRRWKEIGIADAAWDPQMYEQCVARARDALGEANFTMAWDAGRSLTDDQMLAEALAIADGQPVEPPPHPTPLSLEDRHGLSPREWEVLTLVARRWTDKEIASALFIGPRTVQSHLARIFSKLGVANRREAAAVAARRGLV